MRTVDVKSPIHSSSVAGRKIFVSHNSGRITAYPEVIPENAVLSGLATILQERENKPDLASMSLPGRGQPRVKSDLATP